MIYMMPIDQEIITQETLEFIAAQQQTTQFVIIIVLFLLIFGIGGLWLMFQALKVFRSLGTSIDKLSEVETSRHSTQQKMLDTQQELTSAIRRFSTQNKERYEHVDEMWTDIRNDISNLSSNIDKMYEIIRENPKEHEKVYNLVLELKETLEKTKRETDELERVSNGKISE